MTEEVKFRTAGKYDWIEMEFKYQEGDERLFMAGFIKKRSNN